MMDISRRKFLRLAPVGIGAFVVGAVVLPKITPAKSAWAEYWDAIANNILPSEKMLMAAQKAADPPQMTMTEVIARKEEFIRYVDSVL